MTQAAQPGAGESAAAGGAAAPIIEARDVVKSYVGVPDPVLRGVTLKIEEGQLAVLIGPSGCGKTTFLRCLNGLERYDTGTLNVAGCMVEGTAHAPDHSAEAEREIRMLRQRVGFVFQQFNLFPHMDVLHNIMLAPMKVRSVPREQAEETALRLLQKVGLRDKAQAFPERLSGGQQQRVAIARSLAMEPRVILYDEPTSALDPEMREEVLKVMHELREEKITQVVVTHEMSFARDGADMVFFKFKGKVHEAGPPKEVFGDPRTDELRSFLRKFLEDTGGGKKA